MKMLWRIAALCSLAAYCSSAQAVIPDTVAGQTLKAFLDAFNSGDHVKVESFINTYRADWTVDGMIGFRNQTGGFDLVAVDSSEPTRVVFRVKDKNGAIGRGFLLLKNQQPPIVETLSLRALPPGVRPVNVVMDAAERKKVIEGVSQELNEYYVDPDLARKMADALEQHAAKGNYDAISDGDAFANRLMHDLRDVSHDRHLRVDFNPFKSPPPGPPTPEDIGRFHEQMLRNNCAFRKVEILPNNIGYVKFDGFADASFCGATLASAMGFVVHTDALIFDIRENGGGQPAMVTLIASYLFDEPTHLIDIYNRKENTTQQNWTLSYLAAARMTKQPVFVLTSKGTFSGAEEFAFDLKNQKRATIVGETTGGGAHPVSGHLVADYFMVGVPFAKSLDPVTKTNWEGTGVEPDVKAPAADALATAEKLALEKIQSAKTGK